MKVGDKVWIPVTVVELDNDGTTRVKSDDMAIDDFWVDETEIQTVTAEDYRNALSEFYEMNAKERSEIWGVHLLINALKITAEEFVGRLRKCREEPKTGQIWKYANMKVVVLETNDLEVNYYVSSGKVCCCKRNYFEANFCNTGEVLRSVATFLKDLEGLNGR